MNITENLKTALEVSLTAFHAVAHAKELLLSRGYTELAEGETWNLTRGGRYFTVRDGSALLAFCVGEEKGGFRIVASHADSPALKVKGNPVTYVGGCAKLNVEVYGGPLLYSWLDTPLRLAGRAVYYNKDTRTATVRLVNDTHTYVIPSQAIHMNREANSGLSLNAQVDMQPIVSLSREFALDSVLAGEGELLSYDLYLANGAKPYTAGAEDELLVASRIDNLTSVFGSLEALEGAGKHGVSVAYIADSEEIGSRTRTGAGSDLLKTSLARISAALGEDFTAALASSLLVSCDNAHATHPNHPEKNDPTNPVKLGGGVVVKHHANGNYTTTALTDAAFRALLLEAGVKVQDFYMRSDMPCGGTLGAISLGQVGIRSVDIGLAQLAMHSATETMALADYPELVKALSAFYGANIAFEGDKITF